MARKKLKRMKALSAFANVVEGADDLGKEWHREHFSRTGALILELGCGRGHYARFLASRFPNCDFVGVDIKGARLWQAATAVQKQNLTNVRFLRANIQDIGEYFLPNSVDEFWIPFPDPFPKKRKSKLRLTGPRYLEIYRKLLKPSGVIHLKTDNSQLFDYTLGAVEKTGGTILVQSQDVHCDFPDDELLSFKTTYERRHLAKGKKIRYLKFRF